MTTARGVTARLSWISTKPFEPPMAQHCPRRNPLASSPSTEVIPSGFKIVTGLSCTGVAKLFWALHFIQLSPSSPWHESYEAEAWVICAPLIARSQSTPESLSLMMFFSDSVTDDSILDGALVLTAAVTASRTFRSTTSCCVACVFSMTFFWSSEITPALTFACESNTQCSSTAVRTIPFTVSSTSGDSPLLDISFSCKALVTEE
mmetsp:Transcript_39042/g.62914  ORF Transcript_39042/g.62914 Transcript_39042/m.62914 type:complete len:205 (+) Transcript_39042:386-1000(+)